MVIAAVGCWLSLEQAAALPAGALLKPTEAQLAVFRASVKATLEVM